MKSILHLITLLIFLSLSNSYFNHNNVRRNTEANSRRHHVRKRIENDDDDVYGFGQLIEKKSHHKVLRSAVELEDTNDNIRAHEKALILSKAKEKEAELNDLPIQTFGDTNSKLRYHMDPVFDVLRSGFRRAKSDSDSDSLSSSTSTEMAEFRQYFKEYWDEKRFEALNKSEPPRGDQVNMAAARPWGVKCGDPNQYDVPWGSCMMAAECEPEFRIYRGDKFCGRTSFVCCAIEVSTFDMYQGVEASFEDKSLSTDSEEKKKREKNDKDGDRKKRKDKKRRKKKRQERKKKISKTKKKIINEIHRMLQKVTVNASMSRKKRARQMKRLLKKLKKEYQKDQKAVKDLHDDFMLSIDAALLKKISDIRDMNKNFMKNQTFADIVVNGTMSKKAARMLIEAYPELAQYIILRRSSDVKDEPDYLDYDVEYGFLYYY